MAWSRKRHRDSKLIVPPKAKKIKLANDHKDDKNDGDESDGDSLNGEREINPYADFRIRVAQSEKLHRNLNLIVASFNKFVSCILNFRLHENFRRSFNHFVKG